MLASTVQQHESPVLCLAAQVCLTVCNPLDCSPKGSSVHADSPGKNAREGCHALRQGIFQTQGSNPGLPHCRWILSEPPGKPENTGMGSLSLLQEGDSLWKSRVTWQIFPQESNQGLLHCRQTLHQLSSQGSPKSAIRIDISPSLLSRPPTSPPLPSHPFRSSQSPKLSSLC